MFGVSKPTVTDWVQQGCPYVKKAKGKGDSWEFDSAAVAEWREERAVSKQLGNVAATDIEAIKRRKASAEAAMAELAFKKAEGSLVDFVEVQQAGIDSYSACKAVLLGIPTMLAARIITCQNAEQARAMMESEILRALNELGNWEEEIRGQESGTNQGVAQSPATAAEANG